MPVFDNPRKVIVIPGGGDPVAGFLALLGIAALVVAGIAIDWFLVTYALILEAGAVAIVVILTAGTLLARRYLTVLQWDENAAAVQAARRARVERPASSAWSFTGMSSSTSTSPHQPGRRWRAAGSFPARFCPLPCPSGRGPDETQASHARHPRAHRLPRLDP